MEEQEHNNTTVDPVAKDLVTKDPVAKDKFCRTSQPR
jgi:hypothetical protein